MVKSQKSELILLLNDQINSKFKIEDEEANNFELIKLCFRATKFIYGVHNG
ncbi:hypothetical protein COO91_10455 (plasmid) [Nostoc flagelliforme CCNUN1]|uniref:Uncharacterized protein n=1 Tax=Nostoc flagelliforme CCNUN1 TaxID=2038116 RepID=A0A2K8T980_9NOSO|nr:hypothetical protein COO91_10455 [Nostoc flagelliforme CCNUN1]